MSKFNIRDWRSNNYLNESSEKRMSESEKTETLEAVKRFNELGQKIYKTNEITELIENIKMMAENASKMAIEETADWFDAVSVKRDTKSISDSVKVFEGTFKEISTLQQRLESVFEDIGGKLGKYYEINDLEEAMDAVGKEDGDIDNDGDEDGSDKYLAKKRAAVSKAVKNEDSDYKEKFKDAMDDEGIDSPAELDDEDKKAFFNKVDKMHKSKDEGIHESYVVVDPRGNARPVGSKMQGAQYSKKMGGPKKGYHIVLAKNALKARRAIEKNRGNSTDSNIQDLMFDLMYEGKKPSFQGRVNEAFEGLSNVISGHGMAVNFNTSKKETIKEGFATWKMQFAAMTLGGVELDPKKVYTVKARSTVEAIKKASKMAGIKGDSWMATQTHKLTKVG